MAVKLKSSGDPSSAAILERCVREQKSTTAANAAHVPVPSAPASDPISIEIVKFEVNTGDIPNESILKASPTALNIKQIREEPWADAPYQAGCSRDSLAGASNTDEPGRQLLRQPSDAVEGVDRFAPRIGATAVDGPFNHDDFTITTT